MHDWPVIPWSRDLWWPIIYTDKVTWLIGANHKPLYCHVFYFYMKSCLMLNILLNAGWFDVFHYLFRIFDDPIKQQTSLSLWRWGCITIINYRSNFALLLYHYFSLIFIFTPNIFRYFVEAIYLSELVFVVKNCCLIRETSDCESIYYDISFIFKSISSASTITFLQHCR